MSEVITLPRFDLTEVIPRPQGLELAPSAGQIAIGGNTTDDNSYERTSEHLMSEARDTMLGGNNGDGKDRKFNPIASNNIGGEISDKPLMGGDDGESSGNYTDNLNNLKIKGMGGDKTEED